MVANMAQSWSAIAAGSAPKAYAIHMGLNGRDARDTAVSQCGAGDCKVVAAFTLGQCAAVVRARSRGSDVADLFCRGRDAARSGGKGSGRMYLCRCESLSSGIQQLHVRLRAIWGRCAARVPLASWMWARIL
jgi:hypothetical protein